ncbi:MAG: nitroreductase family protein [Bacillota bacterium]
MNDTLKTIHKLHTTHGNFSRVKISDDELQTIIKASVRAANASARQSYSIIVIEDRQDMKEYLQYEGSKALIFCVDFTRLCDTAEYLGHQYDCGGVVDFVTACTDTAMAAQTAAIAAQSLGIDYMFTNSIHRNDLSRLCSKLELPQKYCFPLIALVLGYAKTNEVTVRGRLDGIGIVHYKRYQRLSKAELQKLVDLHDDEGKNMGVVFFKRNKEQIYDRYMDWFYRIWCKPDSQLRSQKRQEMTDFLKQSGFLD